MSNLIVCCDGTWNTPEMEDNGVPAPTNVCRFYTCISEADDLQKKYYHPGVGTEGSRWDRLMGGAVGSGLDKNIMSGYGWLARNYQPNDKIFLVGFSRGAYTVRSMTGMISICGLLDLAETPPKTMWKHVEAAYQQCYRQRSAKWLPEGVKVHPDVEVHFLGVWDTVGALGIPNDLAIANLFDGREKYTFRDEVLSDCVKTARHAMAMDELRASFTVTAWTKWKSTKQDVQQLWFPGNHGDVGGGWADSGLSNAALKWMIDEAERAGLRFEQGFVDQIESDYRGQLHQVDDGIYTRLRSQPRNVPNIVNERAAFHESAIHRHKSPPITQAPYWKTINLDLNESETLSIFAREPWNATGIWLDEAHTYKFEAVGEWLDRDIPSGPGGTSDGDFHIGELVHVFASGLGKAEGLFRWVTGNPDADFRLTRREEDWPWFALVGAVANAKNPGSDGTPQRHEMFLIGKGAEKQPEQSGYLYCFANDAWGFYDNNRGSVELTVTRTK